MLKLDNITLMNLAPPSIKNDKNISAILKALDPELQEINSSISQLLIYSQIDSLPEKLIDLLAWQWHVDFYELANNLDAKREMVKGSIEWHRHKGTAYAILKALEMLGIEAKFIPWYEEIITNPEDIHDLDEFPPLSGIEALQTEKVISKSTPYTFSLDAKLNDEFWERVNWSKPTQSIRRAIVESKAARSYASKIYVHFEDYLQRTLSIKQIAPQGIFVRVNVSQQQGRILTHAISPASLVPKALTVKVNTAIKRNANELKQNANVNNLSITGILDKMNAKFNSTRQISNSLTTSQKSITGGELHG